MITREVVRSDDKVDALIDRCIKNKYDKSEYPGMSYEEGIIAAIEWLTGECDDYPFDEE